jgi:hypothetical protein
MNGPGETANRRLRQVLVRGLLDTVVLAAIWNFGTTVAAMKGLVCYGGVGLLDLPGHIWAMTRATRPPRRQLCDH